MKHLLILNNILVSLFSRYNLQKIHMSPKKGPFYKEISSSNHQFSGDILVFMGVHFSDSSGSVKVCISDPLFQKWYHLGLPPIQ